MTVPTEKVRVYTFAPGESYEERIDDLESLLAEHYTFDTAAHQTAEIDGVTVRFTTIEPANAGLELLHVGPVEYPNKKTALAVAFQEVDPSDVPPEDASDLREAIQKKNTFLEAATGRDADSRRDAMKRRTKDT